MMPVFLVSVSIKIPQRKQPFLQGNKNIILCYQKIAAFFHPDFTRDCGFTVGI
jgi:hypothetical protein